MMRIDGLNNLLSSVCNAVYGRFFAAEERAFARTLQLRVRPEDLPELKALYEEGIWKRLKELDEAAKDDPDALPMDLSICWAPKEVLATTAKE